MKPAPRCVILVSMIPDPKAYLPSCDRVRDVRVADWASAWPRWLPDEGLALEDSAESA